MFFRTAKYAMQALEFHNTARGTGLNHYQLLAVRWGGLVGRILGSSAASDLFPLSAREDRTRNEGKYCDRDR